MGIFINHRSLILVVCLSVLFLRQNKDPGKWVGPSHEKRLLQMGKTIANANDWVSFNGVDIAAFHTEQSLYHLSFYFLYTHRVTK